MSKKKNAIELVILDRDGVINEDSDAFIKNVSEFKPLPGSIDAIAKLSQAGIVVAVATNQSGLRRGLFSSDTLDAMHQNLKKLVQDAGGEIAYIAYCPHGPDDVCACRKPKPGLLLEISKQLKIPFDRVVVVGDSLRDLEAAEAVHAKPVLVLTGKGAKTLEKHPDLRKKIDIYPNLAYFVAEFLQG